MGVTSAILLIIFIHHCNAQLLCAKSSPFLAGTNTPVWFLESNPKNSKNPTLKHIPNALKEAGLININNNNSSNENSTNASSGIKKRTLYLEILVAVDYNLYKKLGENIDDALEYIISFWSSVDLRFRPLRSPRIYINLAGIVIAKDDNAMYYIQENKDVWGRVDGNAVIFEQGKYFKNKNQTANHDILVTLTGEDVCIVDTVRDVCKSETIGASLIGASCLSHLSTAIVEDNGAFNGVVATTHEIAHLLGIPHDGTDEAAPCMTCESYIMAPSIFKYAVNNFRWSSCSKEIFNQVPAKRTAECLKNIPNPGSLVQFLLPGQVLSANQLCQRTGNDVACYNPKRMCNKLICFSTKRSNCKKIGITPDGTICGENKFCFSGECIPDN
ncbi:A disintegrin and metalloproteinase with thrombospondin motifs like [Phymastichus coffea]|uniref:A disintegrin and metalloproteinase with thrombospondin motifs like n=1 Tax=Phymastichus coffea TaxID=108790 RepID=UPI00273C854A|nr:A disintegrin and metalloproteinase with thrombospondin motifs like [Phymastichus coffea]